MACPVTCSTGTRSPGGCWPHTKGRESTDTAIVTTRMIELDAMSNFTMGSATALTKLGKVSLYAFAYERPRVDGVDIRLLGGRNAHTIGTNIRSLLSTFKLAKELSRNDVLIIVNPDIGSMPAYHLAKRLNSGLKVMWTFHGLTPVQFVSGFRDRMLMRLRRMASIRSMRRADLVQVFSGFVKNEVAGWGVNPSKVAIMPFGVDLGRMASGDGHSIREKFGVGDEFLLLYVGRLVEFKHVDELIKAVQGLVGVRLLVVGGGPERERLEELSEGLHGDVRFAGRVPDGELPDYYAACDAWATASRHEGFCVPIAEAMAAGKPTILPDIAAMPQTAGDAGLTYESGDVDGLIQKVKSLATDKALYARLSERATARAASYRLENVLGRYVCLVEDLWYKDRLRVS